ncbi:MAG: Gfo/Idh/MocA family oxidoreductase [Spirochaetaceae bacterium]|jgi:predicted dehydrogenase|nr:Gfo/Idh/MocA family oxidoreductase [Spirochaetaceae bacterium]
MNTVNIGIIGLGNMGTVHGMHISGGKIPGLVLTAVADARPERRTWAETNLPAGITIFSDSRELIRSKTCDAVLIATPHYQHPELAIASFAEGLHVLCEKPAGVYTKEVRAMNAAGEKSGKVFALMFNQRTNCIYRGMHDLVTSGRMGQIKRVSWIITDWYRTESYYKSGQWRATWAGEGGGVLLNQCPHQLDLLQWICGMPKRIRAFCHNGKWHSIEVEDDVTAYLEYPNGATGTFITSTADAPGTNRFEITLEMGKLVCEHGILTKYLLDRNEREFCKTAPGGFDSPACTQSVVETDGQNEQHIGVLRAFAGKILEGTPLVAEGSEGIFGLTLSNGMHLSSWLDRTIDLPLDEDLFLQELNKRRGEAPGRPRP